MDETVVFNRYGKSIYRVCYTLLYDFMGKPRGFLVGKTIYDLRGQHRGFYEGKVVWDRMGRVVGFADGANVNGLTLPAVEVPPVPYRNLPEPQPPEGLKDVDLPGHIPGWSMMRLENLLV
jgi:hypothetical protein